MIQVLKQKEGFFAIVSVLVNINLVSNFSLWQNSLNSKNSAGNRMIELPQGTDNLLELHEDKEITKTEATEHTQLISLMS